MKARYVVVIVAVTVLVIAAVVWQTQAWPRLAPGTQCIVVGDHDGNGIICRLASDGYDYRVFPGDRAMVIDDITGSIWDPVRYVRVRLERHDYRGSIARMNLATVR